MEFNIEQIVTAEELFLDVEIIKSKLQQCPEILVFNNNQPQFLICTLSGTSGSRRDGRTVTTSLGAGKDMKIGALVKENMRKLCYQNVLSEEEVMNLTNPKYSSDTFNLSFPVLKEYDPTLPFDEQKRDAKGYNRYYNSPITVHSKQYLLCSQWVENLHRKQLEAWLEKWDKNTNEG